MLDFTEVPNDLEACQQLLRDLMAAHRRLQEVYQELLATCATVQKSQQQLEQEKAELEQTIKQLMHRLYGRRTERHVPDPNQMPLDFGEDEPVIVQPDVSQDEAFVEEHEKKRRARRGRRRANTGRFPDHLERRTERIEPPLPPGVSVEDCEQIGVDVVEILEFDRPKLWVRRLEYPKYKVPDAAVPGIVQAAREVSLIPGGSFGFGIAAEVLHNKFALHVPLYRQQDPFAQLGWAPNRSTLCQIVARSAELLYPLALLETKLVLAAPVINTDDTSVTLLTAGEGNGSRKARLWIYHGRQSPCAYDVFAFTESRARAGPDDFLRPFSGTLCGDCYSGYVNIETVTGGRIVFSACNAHARRYVYNARTQHPELSSQILGLYQLLYDVEDRGRLLDTAGRLVLRRRESVPLMQRLEQVIHGPLTKGLLPKSKLGSAVNYLRNNWSALAHFLSDGRVPIDNNEAERTLRCVAVGRKNWLFVGSQDGGERLAIILTVIASAHRHDLDVWSYLRDVLEQLARGPDDLTPLLPDVWKEAHPDKVRVFRAEERQHRSEGRRYRRAQRRIERVAGK